jgi:GNAT superfamily N-acetyltransferase
MPADLRLRPPAREDAGALAELIEACDASHAAWAPRGWQPPRLVDERVRWTARVDQPGRWSRVAAGIAIAGLISWTPALTGEGELVEGLAHVDALFVAPARWRQGIASALLAAAEEAMTAGGCEHAGLWTPEGAPAEAFYRHAGWRRDGRREWHRPLGLMVVGYRRRLG